MLKSETKQAIYEYVERLDPRHEVVHLLPSGDWATGTVRFSPNIVQRRVETALTGEKYVEAYFLVRAVMERRYDVGRFELQKEYTIGRPKATGARADILLHGRTGEGLFCLVEAKDPDDYERQKLNSIKGQLFAVGQQERANGLKYLCYYSVELVGAALVEQATIIDFERYQTYDDWFQGGTFATDIFPGDYGRSTKSVYVNKDGPELEPGEKPLNESAGQNVFSSLRRNLHDVLWAGGGMFYNDIFTNLVKLILTKIYDEQTCDPGDEYACQIKLIDGHPESPGEAFERINSLFRAAQREFLGIESDTGGIDREKISPEKVAYVIEQIQPYSFVENNNPENTDLLGQFFEGIVEQGFKQSRGQFFTHRNIVRFIVHALQITSKAEFLIRGGESRANPRLPYISDPAAGSGTFLIEPLKIVTQHLQSLDQTGMAARTRQELASLLPTVKPGKWADRYIYGVELNKDLALATKVNMVVHGDGNINVFALDGLANFEKFEVEGRVPEIAAAQIYPNPHYSKMVNERFDFILSNPPFSVKADDNLAQDYRGRFELSDPIKSENLFVERWFQLLRSGGKIGAVLPESVFDTEGGSSLRLFLYKFFKVDAVVSLPYLAFKPFTSTKTAIIFATKRTPAEVERYVSLEREAAPIARWIGRYAVYIADQAHPEHAKSSRALSRLNGAARAVASAMLECGDTETEIRSAIQAKPVPYWADEFDVRQAVFRYVAEGLDHPIFFAEAEEVGYKRRKQGGDLVRGNDLFFEADGLPRIEPDGATILEKMLSPARAADEIGGFWSTFSAIGKQKGLRCDPKYRWFWDKLGGRVLDVPPESCVPLEDYLALDDACEQVPKGALAEECTLIELENVQSKTGRVIETQKVEEVGSNKMKFGAADILLSKLEPYLGKAFINVYGEDALGSTEWLPLKVAQGSNREFWHRFLLSPEMLRSFRLVQSGKRHARAAWHDIRRMLVPRLDAVAQERLVEQLNPLWTEVDNLIDRAAEVQSRARDRFSAALQAEAQQP